jgi:hypothetical protein
VIFRSPFQPFLAVDNDDEPVRSRQADAFHPFTPALAKKALEIAERDFEANKKRHAQLEHEATMTERKRIVAILYSPVALRHPRIAKRVALESDSPAHEAIEALEQYERENAASNAKATADLIIRAGRKARGELPCDVHAGPKNLVKVTSEEILAAARKARGVV